MTGADQNEQTSEAPRHRLAQVLSPATLAVGAALGFVVALIRPRHWR